MKHDNSRCTGQNAPWGQGAVRAAEAGPRFAGSQAGRRVCVCLFAATKSRWCAPRPRARIPSPSRITDRAAFERRPALVISEPILESRFGLLLVLMITAAANRSWESEVPIRDHRAAGLSIPSIIRPTKVATVEASQARSRDSLVAARDRMISSRVRRPSRFSGGMTTRTDRQVWSVAARVADRS